ncbi:helix-turn-helix domain-containing protein [Bacillus mycoides]|uniref:helix-turn-helix domain-containing protein n=1 Tax=Bacillus mycoides TaxID=1405 RepID=UPI003D25CDDC
MITSRILSLILKFSTLTQYEFAAQIGISQSALSRYLLGEREIPHEVAARIMAKIGDHNLFLLQTYDSGLKTAGADIKNRMRGRD